MFLSLFVSGCERALLSLEASNVIGMRLQMLAKGDAQALHELVLMISEKLEAFVQAGTDVMAGVSASVIRDNYRVVFQANEARLKALRFNAGMASERFRST